MNVYSAGVIDSVWYKENFDNWIDYSGFDSNSPKPTDPMFTNAPSDLSLQLGSPAIGAGVPISWITTDYYGNPRDPKPQLLVRLNISLLM